MSQQFEYFAMKKSQGKSLQIKPEKRKSCKQQRQLVVNRRLSMNRSNPVSFHQENYTGICRQCFIFYPVIHIDEKQEFIGFHFVMTRTEINFSLVQQKEQLENRKGNNRFSIHINFVLSYENPDSTVNKVDLLFNE